MKTIQNLLIAVLAAISLNQASAQMSDSSDHPNSVEAHLHNIVDRVHNCALLPYTINESGARAFHAILSHCPEVKTLANGSAKIKVAGHQYSATLVEATDSDGDFYHVQIKDLDSKEVAILENIPAYGDILLGILSGDTRGIPQVQISDSDVAIVDANLMISTY